MNFQGRGDVVGHRVPHTGVDAMRLIAADLADCQDAPKPLGGRRLTRSDFDTARDRFTALGAALKAEPNACWLRFVELRAEYEAFLSSLAERLLVPTRRTLLLPLEAPDEEAL